MSDSINSITAANLRVAADLLAQHSDLPQPYITTSSDGTVAVQWFLTLDHHRLSDNQKADAALIIKAIGGRWDRDERNDDIASWRQKRDGLRLHVQVARETVCERIVVGEETVTIPAVEAAPERIEKREVVEWRCQPLLADETARESVTA